MIKKFTHWLDKLEGKRAMIFVFVWIMSPALLFFLALIIGIFSPIIALLCVFLAWGIFIIMTIILFIKLILNYQ